MAPLDSCARLHWDRGGRVGSYLACGLTGCLLGAGLCGLVAWRTGWPLGLAALSAAVAITTFLGAVELTRRLLGRERIVLYELLFAVLLGAGLALRCAGRPWRSGLDVLIVGLGAFLVCGRIGCLMVGCCHGRPCRVGICYGAEHGRAGFPRYYVGVRLFPLQALEALLLGALTGAAVVLSLRPHAPGAVLALFLCGYGVVRFALEFFRGDPTRASLLGLSEAQWWALLSSAGAALLSGAGAPLALAGLLWAAAAAWIALRPLLRGAPSTLLQPRHVAELADAVAALAEVPDDELWTCETSAGVRLSASLGREGPARVRHLALSRPAAPLSHRAGRAIADQICLLARASAPRIVEGRHGVTHVILPA